MGIQTLGARPLYCSVLLFVIGASSSEARGTRLAIAITTSAIEGTRGYVSSPHVTIVVHHGMNDSKVA
jgi:hypothetical protein